MRRLLLIDDDPQYSELLGQRLSGLFDCCFASTVHDGIAQMDEREPDVILLDLKLPDADMEGTKTLARVKEHRKRAAIVIVSGPTDPKTVHDYIAGNASGYFVKGRDDVDPVWMEKEIGNAIASHRFAGVAFEGIKQLKAP